MSGDFTVVMDGRALDVAPGETLLSVARRNGISIPTLCHEPRLAPDPSCWLCVVEVSEGDSEPRLEPSCGTAARPGQSVLTRSERVDEARRSCLELLLSDHYADCVAPCALACPAQVDIPGYVRAVEESRFAEAVTIVRRTNPLPSVCGRVCPHPCEVACHRSTVDSALAINPLKRLATDHGLPPPPLTAPDTGRRVAIVGAGPAGLSAAWFLRLLGHAVVIYDARERAGGMLRYGIPRYRLPENVLDADIDAILNLGVELELGRRLGEDLSVQGLLDDGADAVFLALGAWGSRRLGLEGENAAGIRPATNFLRVVEEGRLSSLEGTVLVIGGGNTAVDAARTALRLGASRVSLLYRRTRAQMPAFGMEVDAALEEGVELTCLVSPVALDAPGGRLAGVTLQHMRLEPAAEGKRPRPVPIEGSTEELAADHLLTAIGELADLGFAASEPDPALAGRLNQAQPGSLLTPSPRVFAGGDFVTGPATAVEAIAAGRRVAKSIDAFLRTGQPVAPKDPIRSQRTALSAVESADYTHVTPVSRVRTPEAPAAVRARGFQEVEHTLADDAGVSEAGRCLRCSCSSLGSCVLPRLMNTYGANPARYRGEHHRYRPVEARPGLTLDMNKCIRCARCVRVCEELAGVGAWTFVERGFDTRLLFVAPVGEDSLLACDRCLRDQTLCVTACPTGALVRSPAARSGPDRGDP